MTVLTGTVQTDRPRREVFAYLSDFSTVADWDPGIVASVPQDDGGPALGARYLVTAGFAGRRLEMVYEVIAFEPPARVALRGTTGGFTAVDEIRVEESGGQTRVDYRAEFTLSGFLRFVEPLMRPAFRRLGDRAMDGLAEALGGTRVA